MDGTYEGPAIGYHGHSWMSLIKGKERLRKEGGDELGRRRRREGHRSSITHGLLTPNDIGMIVEQSPDLLPEEVLFEKTSAACMNRHEVPSLVEPGGKGSLARAVQNCRCYSHECRVKSAQA
jgi:hypothetical protein